MLCYAIPPASLPPQPRNISNTIYIEFWFFIASTPPTTSHIVVSHLCHLSVAARAHQPPNISNFSYTNQTTSTNFNPFERFVINTHDNSSQNITETLYFYWNI